MNTFLTLDSMLNSIAQDVENQLSQEYRDYMDDCKQCNEKPWSFQDWFEVSYINDFLNFKNI